jgi:GT2 family glycosyltransferase
VDRVREKMVPQIPHFLTTDLHERNRILRYHFHCAGILVEGALDFHCVALQRRAVEIVGDLDESEAGEYGDREYPRRLRKAGYVLGLALDTYINHDPDEAEQDDLLEAEQKEARRASAAR